MKIRSAKFDQMVKKFQEGGEMAPPATPEEAPQGAPAEGGDPMQQLLQAAAQAVQTQDAQLALQVCQALVEMAGAPQEAPAEPVYKRGGKLSRRLN